MITLANAIITIQNYNLEEELKIFLLFFIDITNKIKNYDRKITIKEIRENSRNLLLHKTNKINLNIDESLYEFLKKNKKALDNLEEKSSLEKLLKILSKDKIILEKLNIKKNKIIINSIAKLIKQQISTTTPETKPIPLIDINLYKINNVISNTIKGITRFNNIAKIETFINSLANEAPKQKNTQKKQISQQIDIENQTIIQKKQFIQQTIPTLVSDKKISDDLIKKLTYQLENLKNFTKIRPLNKKDAEKEKQINTIIKSLANKKPIDRVNTIDQIKQSKDTSSRSERYIFALSVLVNFLNHITKKTTSKKGITHKTKQYNIKKINKMKINEKQEKIKIQEAEHQNLSKQPQQNKHTSNKKLKTTLTFTLLAITFAIMFTTLIALSNLTTITCVAISILAPLTTILLNKTIIKKKKNDSENETIKTEKYSTHQIIQSYSKPLLTNKQNILKKII